MGFEVGESRMETLLAIAAVAFGAALITVGRRGGASR
jgi:hypothetical protein